MEKEITDKCDKWKNDIDLKNELNKYEISNGIK